jgi:hypothetical protein
LGEQNSLLLAFLAALADKELDALFNLLVFAINLQGFTAWKS